MFDITIQNNEYSGLLEYSKKYTKYNYITNLTNRKIIIHESYPRLEFITGKILISGSRDLFALDSGAKISINKLEDFFGRRNLLMFLPRKVSQKNISKDKIGAVVYENDFYMGKDLEDFDTVIGNLYFDKYRGKLNDTSYELEKSNMAEELQKLAVFEDFITEKLKLPAINIRRKNPLMTKYDLYFRTFSILKSLWSHINVYSSKKASLEEIESVAIKYAESNIYDNKNLIFYFETSGFRNSVIETYYPELM